MTEGQILHLVVKMSVKMLVSHIGVAWLDYLVPTFDFCTQEGSSDGSSNWALATHVGDLE